MKRKLSVILISLLVLCSLLTIDSPNISAQTNNLKILSYSYYIDMLGNIVVVGEVQNTGSTIVEFAIISGAVTGSDGSYVEAGNRAWGENLLPGEKAPFYLDFLAQYTNSQTWYAGIASIDLQVYRAPTTTQYQYQEVNILNDKPAPNSNGEYWVNGDLKNNGNQKASNITVFATFYNSSGKVIAAGFSNTISSLAAGGSEAFKVAAFDLNQTLVSSSQKISGYSLRVQVQAPMQSGTAPTANSTIIPVPTIESSPSNDNTQKTGDQNLIYIGLILGAVTIIIIGFRLLKRSKPKNKSAIQNQPQKEKRKKP